MEKSTIFVSPRFHTDYELRGMTHEDFKQLTDGPMRPCFGCHKVIPPYWNRVQICESCKFPMHSQTCAASEWHSTECHILKRLTVQSWYDEIGSRDNIMIHLAVLRGILLKESKPHIWNKIMAVGCESAHGSVYLTSESLKHSTLRFILHECMVDWVEENEIVKFLSIFMKHRLNCCMVRDENKRYVIIMSFPVNWYINISVNFALISGW